MTSALSLVATVIEQVIRAGIPRSRVAVLGFSQEACLATEFVTRHAGRYGGLVALTGGLIGPEGTEFRYAGDLAGTSCFLGSGGYDPQVRFARVEASPSILSELGGTVTLRRYPGRGYIISRDQIDRARSILSPFAQARAAE